MSKLTHEQYRNIRQMLSSSDVENHNVAFSLLDNIDIKSNFIYISLLVHFHSEPLYRCDPKLISKIVNLIKDTGATLYWNVQFSDIFKYYRKNNIKLDFDDLQILVSEYAEAFKIGLKDITNENFNIKITIEHEQSGVTSESL